jgi:Family of unknown function (DUF6527)
MPRIETIKLARVQYIPRVLEPGILYLAEQYGAVAHLCACGCGSKVSTPLAPTEWSLKETASGPSLRPSIGNWQLPCQSHYWIRDGEIIWAGAWTPEQIAAGRKAEEQRRSAYYEKRRRAESLWRKLWRWLQDLFTRQRS